MQLRPASPHTSLRRHWERMSLLPQWCILSRAVGRLCCFVHRSGFFLGGPARSVRARFGANSKDDFRNFRCTSAYFQWGPVRGVAVWFQQSGNRRFGLNFYPIRELHASSPTLVQETVFKRVCEDY